VFVWFKGKNTKNAFLLYHLILEYAFIVIARLVKNRTSCWS